MILAGVGGAAAVAGALVGPLLLQSGSGAATLQAAALADLQGRPRRLIDWAGTILVCNFWATWCKPCAEEIPMLIALRDQYVSKGIEVIGIAVDSADKVAEFAKTYRISYPVLTAGAAGVDLMRAVGNERGALPYTVLLDRKGAIEQRKLGLLKREELGAWLDELIVRQGVPGPAKGG